MGSGEGSGSSGICPGLIYSFAWFIVLVFLGWPIAFFISWLYVLLLPFSACISPLVRVCETILRVVQLPLACAENLIKMKPLC
ncbi:expressed conserved protein [Elysia marginata]|uniref:Expressed conserved protein n=1 Tax=Elysia marginata TaxID=1093978 RepID=A0AAV4GAS5_9GAST|nr:expressed conserved protein [Elysia marginata]